MAAMKDKPEYLILEEALRKAKDKAERTNRALNLDYLVVRDGRIYKVHPDGEMTYVKDAEFGSVKIKQQTFQLRETGGSSSPASIQQRDHRKSGSDS